MRRQRIGALALSIVLVGASAPLAVGVGPPGLVAPAGAVERDVTPTAAGELVTARHVLTGPAPGGDGRAGAPGAAPAGWGTEVEVDPGTQMVGLTWEGAPASVVDVRGRQADGTWTEWLDLDAELPEVDGGRTAAGPAWLASDGVDRVEVRVASGSVSDLRLEAMAWTASAVEGRSTSVDQPATPAGGPPIHTRAAWAPGGWQGHRSGCTPAPSTMAQLRFAVVHHTVNANTYSQADVPGILAGIYRFHTGTNGWCDVAYNVFIDRFGRTWEGRTGGLNHPIMGGHARGFNTHSVGVALLGQHQPGASPAAVAPSAAAMTALRDVLAWKLSSHGANPQATIPITSQGSPRYPAGQTVNLPTIQGHRDSGLTSCPGDLVYGQLGNLRAQVAQRIAATHQPSRWSPQTTGPAFFGRIHERATGRSQPNGQAGLHTSLVVRAGWPRDALAASTVLSEATQLRISTASRLYGAAFDRLPDVGGLKHWVGERDRGMYLTEMARRFTGTSEFQGRYGHLGNRAFVAEIYRNVLGRAPDPGGWNYWEDRLNRGLTRHQFLATFSETPEHKQRTAVDSDITRAYLILLDRVTTPDERATWRQALGGGTTGAAMVAMLINSQEYRARG